MFKVVWVTDGQHQQDRLRALQSPGKIYSLAYRIKHNIMTSRNNKEMIQWTWIRLIRVAYLHPHSKSGLWTSLTHSGDKWA